jgi:PAS domain S-box-containing protein|tara:strand:+ start:1085 stop:4165 length:3081 start_codon:yes stop_codon:yes gene_type:complete
MVEPKKVLVVDSASVTADLIRQAFDASPAEYNVTVAPDLAQAKDNLAEEAPDIVIVEPQLPDGSGMELLPGYGKSTSFPIMMLASEGNVALAVQALKSGAVDYLVKSASTLSDICIITENALSEWQRSSGHRRMEEDHLQTVERLQKSEQMYAEAERIGHFGHWVRDFTGETSMHSAGGYHIHGIDKERFDQGRDSFQDHIHPDDREILVASAREAFTQLKPLQTEYRVSDANGDERIIEVKGEVFFDENAEPRGMKGTYLDITERIRTEKALMESEERYREVIDRSQDVIWRIDPKGVFTFASPSIKEMSGFEPDEVIGLAFMRGVTEESRTKAVELLDMCLRGEMGDLDTVFELTHIHKNGSEYVGEVRAVPLLGRDGEVVGVQGITRDITDRKRTGERLHILANRNEAILASVPDIVMEVDIDKRYIWANEAGIRFFGEDVLGKAASDYFIGQQDTYLDVQPLFDGDATIYVESLQKRCDGEERLLAWWCRTLLDDAGNATGALSTARDITDQKRAERVLIESEERLQAVIDNSPMVIYLKDTEGRYILINRAYQALSRLTKDEVIGKTDHDLYSEEAATTIRENDQAVLTADAPLEFEQHLNHADGLHTYASVKFALSDANGKIYGVCGISSDITERKRMEDERIRLTEELNQAQKMDAIGQLASGVAHDFNNLLQVISAHAELTKAVVQPESEIAESMKSVSAAVDQAVGVTRSLLTFSQKTSASKRLTDLCATVDQTMQMLQRTLPATIELTVDTDCDPSPWINADPTQVQQIILNLAINARDAMPDGGMLYIAVHPPEFVESKAALHSRIVLRDSGTGIPAEMQQLIFEPFFTTKKSGHGTGLGLSIIQSIVEDHDGFLELDSTDGAGATFTIYLPCVPPQLDQSTGTDKVVAPVGNDELILVAEDNQQNCDIIAGTLVSLGYKVVKASDGIEILNVFHQLEEEIRLLILDVGLPKQSGLASLQTIRESGSNTPAIMITGSADAQLDDQLDEFTVLLSKPFSMNKLGSQVVEKMQRADQ